MVVGDIDPPAILGSRAGGGDVATQADQAARSGHLVHRSGGTIGHPRFRGGAQIQAYADRDTDCGWLPVDLDRPPAGRDAYLDDWLLRDWLL